MGKRGKAKPEVDPGFVEKLYAVVGWAHYHGVTITHD